METTVNNNNVNQQPVLTAKAVGKGAKNAALYSVEKPLVGVAILLRTTSAVIGALGQSSMKGAVALHTVRKDEESAKAMVQTIDKQFAAVSSSLDAKMKIMQDKMDAIKEKRAANKRIAQAEADKRKLEEALEIVAKHKATMSVADSIAAGPLR